jgi:Mechanosensitive ion channel, conserved TM helix
MQGQTPEPFIEYGQRLTAYLPTLTAGLVVVAAGFVVGWIAKRVVVRALILLRLDRLGGRFGWQAAFAKGDVRAALYNLIGTLTMLLIVLVFTENALHIWGLTVLSTLLGNVIVYVPNLVLVGAVTGVGVMLVNSLSEQVAERLEEEHVPRPRLIASLFKAALLALVGAIALWQLNLARQIVLAGFLIAFGALGVSFALAVGIGSAKAVQRGWEALLKEPDEPA